MTFLILGVILWISAHFLKRLAPNVRHGLGDKGRSVIAIIILLGLALMVIGYRAADFIPVYQPLPGMGHANNTLMIVALFLMGAGSTKGITASKIRHPMLMAAIVWSIAHLLVNGDLASLILFGGIGAWAFTQMLMINRAEGPWQAPAAGPFKKDMKAVVIALVLYIVIAFVHVWLGHNPFLGTYG
ncbi:NnrU family protein [Cochlodiniinecator piscidefendens]|uniref:NnrU family protein n=1 Tax=Cochlodiniinecator piscidefendens TaxID=2715756 RepID=UPI00140D5A43|nr:NnrU family protein [Cochlodiniinecator piscidefendens]